VLGWQPSVEPTVLSPNPFDVLTNHVPPVPPEPTALPMLFASTDVPAEPAPHCSLPADAEKVRPPEGAPRGQFRFQDCPSPAQHLLQEVQEAVDFIMSDAAAAPAAPVTCSVPSQLPATVRVSKAKHRACLQFDPFEFALLNRSLPRALTVDVTADSSDALLPVVGSASDQALIDLAGHACWICPEFSAPAMQSVLQHYFKCKAADPTNTSACFVVPHFLRRYFTIFNTMSLLKTYTRGTKLFTAPPLPGGTNRRSMGPLKYDCYVFYDSPAPASFPRSAVHSHPLSIDDDGEDSSLLTIGDGPGFILSAYAGTSQVPLRVLIDSGATGLFCNYLDKSFADAAGISYTPSAASIQSVTGQTVPCYGTVDISLTLHGVRNFQFDTELVIIDIDGPSCILGYNWLLQYNPVIDWASGVAHLSHAGVDYCLRSIPTAVPVPSRALHMVSANEFKQLAADSDAHIFCVFVKPSDPPSRLMVAASTATQERVGKEMSDSDFKSPLSPELAALVGEFPSVFPSNKLAVPVDFDNPGHGVFHHIDLEPDARIPFRHPYRLSPAELSELKLQIEALLPAGFISPSSSPFGAPVLFASKKDGGLRFCVDYRALNNVTIKNRYPLPRIQDLIDKLSSARYFSALDCFSGFWQIPVAPADRHKTAFNTALGQFQWNVMPFGLCNAPASFQALMDKVLRPLILRNICCVYMDDILVFSKTKEEHLQYLREVFAALAEHKIYCKPSKCSFLQTEIKYLGYLIGNGQIKPDPSAVACVTDWSVPDSRSKLRSFLGFANFYRDFIDEYAAVTAPLTDLLSEKYPYPSVFNEDQLSAFESLKTALVTAPALAIYSPDSKSFRVRLRTDASRHAVGAVLEQDTGTGWHPVTYYSKKLNDAQSKYSAYDLELLAINEALKRWRCYLLGVKFDCLTDHNTLKHYLSQKDLLNHRNNRYLDNISQFDVNIIYCKGKDNPADALSRLCCTRGSLFAFHTSPVMATDLSASVSGTTTVQTPLVKVFEDAYKVDPVTQGTYTGSGFMYVGDATCPLLYVPDSTSLGLSTTLRQSLLRECHESPLAAHPGVKRMYASMRRQYFWPGLHTDVKAYVESCDLCRINKSGTSKPWGLLQPLPVPTGRWSDISMDFIGHLPVSKHSGCDCVLVIVDRLTKLVRFIPCKSTITADEAAKLFIKHVFKDFGLAKTMLSDRDTLFVSNFWQSLFKQLGTILPMSCGYHPQTDGQTEIMNKTLEAMLRPYVGASHRQELWEDYLPLVEFAYNSTPQTSTEKSPFELMYGF